MADGHRPAPPADTTVPPLVPRHALTSEVRRSVLDHVKDWMTSPGTHCPPMQVLEQLTAPTPSLRYAQLTNDVLDVELEPLRALYQQAHIPPPGKSYRLARLRLQRRVDAGQAGDMVVHWLTLNNPYSGQGNWYLHQFLLPPQAVPEQHRQDPYATPPERLSARDYPQATPLAPPPPPRAGPTGTAAGNAA